MPVNEPSDQLLREFAALRLRLSQTADPIERRTLLVKMSAILRETDALAEEFDVDRMASE
jgi:hypothetical protein